MSGQAPTDGAPASRSAMSLGTRRGASAILTGVLGVVGAMAGGWGGMWLAATTVGPFELGDPWNLFGNAILVLGPLLVVTAGAVAGFIVGACALPSIGLLALNWPAGGRTIVYLVVLEVIAVPITFLVLILVDQAAEAVPWVWAGGLLIGGVVPALARFLAMRRPRAIETR